MAVVSRDRLRDSDTIVAPRHGCSGAHRIYRAELGPLLATLFRLVGDFSAGTATSVRVREGKRMTTDGPFAETKEQLGGYYLIDVKDLDEAIAVGARIPTSRFGRVEVRPLMRMPGK